MSGRRAERDWCGHAVASREMRMQFLGASPRSPQLVKERTVTSKPLWNGLGDYARAVINQITRRAPPDPRFAAAPTAPSQEGTGADGGYAAPPEVTSEVGQVLLSESTLFGRTDRKTVTRGSFVAPTDQTPPWSGPQATWEGEGQQFATTKMVLASDLLKLSKLTALIPVTSELYEDAVGLDAYLRRAIPAKFDFKLTDALLSGSGVGQILGALNAPALVTQTKESGQTAGTIAYANLTKMWNRMYAPSRATAVWVLHPDAEMAIQGLTTPGGKPAIEYPAAEATGYIFGRPAIVTEAAKPVGTPGDVVLLDPRGYLTATRHPEGMTSAVSMHVWFDADQNAIRFSMRVAGQPWLAAPFTRKNTSTTISTMVALEAR